jgi:hypothetical protein
VTTHTAKATSQEVQENYAVIGGVERRLQIRKIWSILIVLFQGVLIFWLSDLLLAHLALAFPGLQTNDNFLIPTIIVIFLLSCVWFFLTARRALSSPTPTQVGGVQTSLVYVYRPLVILFFGYLVFWVYTPIFRFLSAPLGLMRDSRFSSSSDYGGGWVRG